MLGHGVFVSVPAYLSPMEASVQHNSERSSQDGKARADRFPGGAEELEIVHPIGADWKPNFSLFFPRPSNACHRMVMMA